jgi:hypothetical protein
LLLILSVFTKLLDGLFSGINPLIRVGKPVLNILERTTKSTDWATREPVLHGLIFDLNSRLCLGPSNHAAHQPLPALKESLIRWSFPATFR